MADVNVTSLVDVMLVLLIIFMITAPMMQGGVDVELPRAEARPLSPKEGMVVSVNRDGRIFVDQTPVSYNDFRVTFRSLVATRKPTGVYLQADTRVPYGRGRAGAGDHPGRRCAERGARGAGGRVVVKHPGAGPGSRRAQAAGGWSGRSWSTRRRSLSCSRQVQADQGVAAALRGEPGRGARPHRQQRLAREATADVRRRGEAGPGQAASRRSRRKAPTPPKPKPPPQPTDADQQEPPPKTAAPVTPAPGETPSTGTDVATIKTPGLEFPYPEYLRNIVNQIYQRWDRAGQAEQLRRDQLPDPEGRLGARHPVRHPLREVSPSTSSAQGAIEAAGNTRAFGPLPDGWEADVLPGQLLLQANDR